MTAKERYFILWDIDTLQYENVVSQSATQLMVDTKQLLPVGLIERNGKKYLKYRLVK